VAGAGYISNEHTPVVPPELCRVQIVDIRQLRALDLEPLLREETAEWRTELDWDFSKSAELVRTLAGKGWLNGAALLESGRVTGYGYTGLEGRNASVWDVYLRPSSRGGNAERTLLRALFDALMESPAVDRIESQLMLIASASAEALQRGPIRLFERLLMTLDAQAHLPPRRGSVLQAFGIESWKNGAYDAAGNVISLAYAGQIDAIIHEHYRSREEASRFVYNLIHFPGCVAFHRAASCVAFDRITGQMAGVALSMFIADDVAHIAELCVVPQLQGIGLGYELLRQSVETLRQAGAKRISVTVTAANHTALRLYERFGFRESRRFYAFLWERDTAVAR
jgi:ribosomal protein S18 acetylase RimI-like enzyme